MGLWLIMIMEIVSMKFMMEMIISKKIKIEDMIQNGGFIIN